MKMFRLFGIALLAVACSSIAFAQAPFTAGTWTRVTPSSTPIAGGHPLLLTDGSVLILNNTCNTTGNAYRLFPDSAGNYATGTWVSAGNLPSGYNPLYFASQMLPVGYVIIMGGEYNACNSVWTTLGAAYNPVTNKWISVPAPTGWSSVGDAQSVVLPNGQFMLANCCTTQEAILSSYSPITWTATGTGKYDWNDEEGWTMLPGNKILTVDAYVNTSCCAMGYQIYDDTTGTWSTPSNNTVVNLVDPGSRELGPGPLLPNGTVFYAGATTNNAIYNVAAGTWASAPKFGGTLDIADGPAAVLPDGNALFDASPGIFGTGSKFFEWDGTALNATSAPPNAPSDSSYYGNFVVLPNGQILFTDFSSDIEVYTPSGSPCSGCAPTVSSVATTLTHGSRNNVVKGTQFNGMSQGSYYGDDNQSSSNFPLVRITDSTGHVVYCRTHNWLGGVQTGAAVRTAQFDIPATIATGAGSLQVVVNGIASTAVSVTIN